MKRKKEVIKLCLIVFCLISCTQKVNKYKKNANYDALVCFVDNDNISDTVKVNKIDSLNYEVEFYLSKNGKRQFFKNIIFSNNEIGVGKNRYFNLKYDKNIAITQEYGSASPEGWYTIFVSYKENEFIVDSIKNEKKNFNSTSDKDFIEEIIKKKAKNLNEFKKKEFFELK